MLKELVIHIGQSKTASTFLQYFFSVNREKMAEEGITYLQTPKPLKQVSHRYIFNLLMLDSCTSRQQKNHHSKYLQKIFATDTSDIRTIARQFFLDSLQEKCSTKRGLLSEELLWHLGNFHRDSRRECLNRLKELLERAAPGAKIKLIVYLRPQDSWLESWHNQLVKDQFLQTPIEQMFRNHMHLGAFDYSRIIEDWQEILEPDSIILRPFIPHALYNGSIHEDFFRHGLGLAVDSRYWLPDRKLQVSLHASVCAFVTRQKPTKVEGYKEALQQMSMFAEDFKLFKSKFLTLVPMELRQILEQHVRESNIRLQEYYAISCNFNDYFQWKKTYVPLPLPLRMRQQFSRILGLPVPSRWNDIQRTFKRRLTHLSQSSSKAAAIYPNCRKQSK